MQGQRTYLISYFHHFEMGGMHLILVSVKGIPLFWTRCNLKGKAWLTTVEAVCKYLEDDKIRTGNNWDSGNFDITVAGSSRPTTQEERAWDGGLGTVPWDYSRIAIESDTVLSVERIPWWKRYWMNLYPMLYPLLAVLIYLKWRG